MVCFAVFLWFVPNLGCLLCWLGKSISCLGIALGFEIKFFALKEGESIGGVAISSLWVLCVIPVIGMLVFLGLLRSFMLVVSATKVLLLFLVGYCFALWGLFSYGMLICLLCLGIQLFFSSDQGCSYFFVIVVILICMDTFEGADLKAHINGISWESVF